MKNIFFIIASCLYADDAKTPEPQITVEEQRDWQQARADMVETKAAADAAAKVYADKVNQLILKCGPDHQLLKNAQGNPTCVKSEKK